MSFKEKEKLLSFTQVTLSGSLFYVAYQLLCSSSLFKELYIYQQSLPHGGSGQLICLLVFVVFFIYLFIIHLFVYLFHSYCNKLKTYKLFCIQFLCLFLWWKIIQQTFCFNTFEKFVIKLQVNNLQHHLHVNLVI